MKNILFAVSVVSALFSFAGSAFRVTPYVQHPKPDAMSILWFCDTAGTATLSWWRADADESTAQSVEVAGASAPALAVNTGNVSLPAQYKFAHRLTGLSADTAYNYRVVLAGEGGATYANTFRTAPTAFRPVRFVAYSDSETQTAPKTGSWEDPTVDHDDGSKAGSRKYYVAKEEGFASNVCAMAALKPDFVAVAGDLAGSGDTQDNWDQYWKHYAGALSDYAGATPILAAPGNHDYSNYDAKGNYGEMGMGKYLTYFEYEPNTANVDADQKQRFHRLDYGPVAVIFIDPNNGPNYDPANTYDKWANEYAKPNDRDTNQCMTEDVCRAPDFNPGSEQYKWVEEQLADAQTNKLFTFLVCHQCPYSIGYHGRRNGETGLIGGEGEYLSGVPTRCYTNLVFKYGVDGWICGHDEICEHSRLTGVEKLPDGTEKPTEIHVYDVGYGGDDLRGARRTSEPNPYEVFRAHVDSPEVYDANGTLVSGGKHYGHLEVNVETNELGQWVCRLQQNYVFISKDAQTGALTFDTRTYPDVVVLTNTTYRADPPAPPAGRTLRVGAHEDYTTLNAALADAEDGDTIELVAGEVHTLTTVGEDLLVDKPVTIRGLGATAADVIVKPDTSTDTHRFLSISNENAVVENVTFTGCNILNDDRSEERRRSPMRLYAGTIRNCVIRDNVQLNHGTLEQLGGLVTDCSFTGNRSKSDSLDHSTGRGGALFQYDGIVSNCVFTGNYARNHGGAAVVYGGLMTHCAITGNSIDRSGGSGVTLAGGTLANSFVAQNSASGVGGSGKGAVAIMNGELLDTVVCSNTASVTACGGVFVAALSGNYLNTCECDSTKPRTMTGCRVFANTTSGEGAGVYLVSDATVDRCTIYGNKSVSEVGSGLYQTAGTVRNTIVFGNGVKTVYDADNVRKTGGSFIYSCTQPAVEGDGNTDGDPLFTDLALDDISLRPGSSCIGTGLAADGVTACDMGAVPYRAGEDPVRCGFTVSQTELSAAGAVTLHGYADGADVSGLALKWDFDGDGVADATGAEVEFDVEQAGVYSITLWLEDGGGTRYAAYTRENIVSLKLAIAYVNPNGSNTPPYATPATGAHDLKDAINSVVATEEKPGEIIVMDGTYQCPDAWYVVDKPLYVHSENGPETTILRGWKSGSTAADYRVLKVEHPKALVAGFTLENGNWNSAVNGDPGGSALRLVSGVVSNCVIRDSNGCDYGAGAHVCGGLLTHSTICGNTSYRSNNGTAGKAGGVYQVGGYVEHCVISNNTACNAEGGCGLYITAGTTTCCRITGNYGYYRETTGGIGVFMSGGRVEKCEITGNGVKNTGNTMSGGGVKMSNGELVNCLVAGNRTYGQAAGVYQTGGTVENCTITGNASINQAGSGLYIANGNAIARNNVIFGNGAGVAAEPICNLEYSSAKTFANNIVSPATRGTDNVDADPLFNNAAAGDYTLAAGSPAIDAATEQGLVEDLVGNLRPKDGDGDGDAQPDVGCYEASGADEGELRCSFELTESVGFDAVTSTFTAHVAGTGSTGELAYVWDFGDGVVRDGSATGPAATVEFASCGKHTVSLTVTAAGGSSATYTMADAVSVGVSKAYVNETGNGIWPYATPETATNDLVEVFGSALLADGRTFEIEVDDGDYVIKDKWIVITGNVYLHSKNGPENCRLVADTTRNATERKAICLNNPAAVVEGLTLDAFCWDGNLKGDQGGVVRISAGTMRNCVIQNSRGGNNGAAVDMSGGVLENSILRNNWSVGGNNTGVGSGGGVYLSSGSPIVRNTVISNNYTAASGGGIYCKAAGAVVTNCVIAYNRTSYSQTTPMNNTNRHGGGIYTEAAATFANCAIIGNHARGEGGAVYAAAAAKFINCLIADNAANTTRPGVYMTKAGQFLNCTITGNGTNAVANAIACEITDKATFKNNIVWGNADCATELSLASGATASNNCLEDPHFRNPAKGDWRIRSNSPCVNAGDDSVVGVLPAVDLGGRPRKAGRHIDIGCHECSSAGLNLIVR